MGFLLPNIFGILCTKDWPADWFLWWCYNNYIKREFESAIHLLHLVKAWVMCFTSVSSEQINERKFEGFVRIALFCAFMHRVIKRKLFNITLIYLILKGCRSPSGYKLFFKNRVFYTYLLLIFPLNCPDRLWASPRFSFNSYPCINWPDRKTDRLHLLTSR